MSDEELTLIRRAQAKVAKQVEQQALDQKFEDLEKTLEIDKACLLSLLRQSQDELDLVARVFIERLKTTASLVEKLEQ